MRSRLNRNGLPAAREHVRLRTPELGDDAALIGAAELAFQRLLADPLEGSQDRPAEVEPPAPREPADDHREPPDDHEVDENLIGA